MDKLHIQLLKMRLPIEKDEERCKEIKDILDKDDEKLAELYMKKYHKTIREKKEKIANALGIKTDEIIYDRAENFISNNRNKFEIHSKTIKQFDIYGLNDYEIDFCYCDINIVISKGHSIYAEDINFKSLYFKNCKININVVDNFCCENIHFLNCDIYALNFNQVIIKGNIKFTNSSFIKKSVFNSCIFQDNIYFNNSHFKDSVDFHECEFEKTACFYGVKFDKVPNFSQVQFKGSLNAVNTNLNFGFESLKEKIKQEHIEYNKRESIKKPLAHFANDFRDSFRIFKSTLIKDNNLLDASNSHKCELYCKEVELDSKKTKTLRDKVDKWQLWFYRKLCDHHTDLLLNLKWLVYAIALYVLLLGKIPYVYPVAIFVFCVYVYMRGFKNVWLIVSSAIVFITILNKPKIILGISNLFGEHLNLWQNFITTLYVIAIGLVLFSLQKTARKNSIVPN